jgi:predicted esterase
MLLGMLLLVGALAGGCGSSGSSPIVYQCNGTTGLEQPLPVCSHAQPCTGAISFVNGTIVHQTVTTTSNAPVCATNNLVLNDGPPMKWTDVDGVARYTCVFEPAGASSMSKRPLVVYFHGTGGQAGNVYNLTGIRVKAIDYELSGDPLRPGYLLASVQGRNLHFPGGQPPGRHFDFYYRDMGSPSTNPDIAAVDRLIDTLVAQGSVDTQRIYVMGWSNGALFAQLYAIARFNTATPDGNRVAAGAVYASGNPFANIAQNQTPSCEQSPYPASAVPLYLIHRTCDALTACDTVQAAAFQLPPGRSAEDWVAQLMDPSYVNDANVMFQLIDLSTVTANFCEAVPPCSEAAGIQAHLAWPDGPLYGGGDDWEVPMLDFLRAHPHP